MTDDRQKAHADGFWVGDWFVEPMLNRITRDGEHAELEPEVMDVLLLMAERPGQTVTKEEFLEQVWENAVVTDASRTTNSAGLHPGGFRERRAITLRAREGVCILIFAARSGLSSAGSSARQADDRGRR